MRRRTGILSLIKDWVPFGRTGYPFVFAMKVDAGRKMCCTGSAAHLLSTPKFSGKGGVRSSAKLNLIVSITGKKHGLAHTQR